MIDLSDIPRMSYIKPIEPEHLAGDLIGPDHPLFGLIWINPRRVSGAPCFYGTRLPIKNLFDSLAAGETIRQFMDDYGGVTREQAEGVLKLAEIQLEAALPKA